MRERKYYIRDDVGTFGYWNLLPAKLYCSNKEQFKNTCRGIWRVKEWKEKV